MAQVKTLNLRANSANEIKQPAAAHLQQSRTPPFSNVSTGFIEALFSLAIIWSTSSWPSGSRGGGNADLSGAAHQKGWQTLLGVHTSFYKCHHSLLLLRLLCNKNSNDKKAPEP